LHIQSEQKRRTQINEGFEELRLEIPGYQNDLRVSKAALLTTAAKYIRQLKAERESLVNELERLRATRSISTNDSSSTTPTIAAAATTLTALTKP
jgi:hypothetical protein